MKTESKVSGLGDGKRRVGQFVILSGPCERGQGGGHSIMHAELIPAMIFILLVLAAPPAAWLVADIWGSALTRRALGILAILCTLFTSYVLASRFSDTKCNIEYGVITLELLDASVEQLEAGNDRAVIQELRGIHEALNPKGRWQYKQLVRESVGRLNAPPPAAVPRTGSDAATPGEGESREIE